MNTAKPRRRSAPGTRPARTAPTYAPYLVGAGAVALAYVAWRYFQRPDAGVGVGAGAGPAAPGLGGAGTTHAGSTPGPSEPASPAVRTAQTSLTLLGYTPGPADGHLGPNTLAALRAFQSDQGLPLTSGTLDATTTHALAAATETQRAWVLFVLHRAGFFGSEVTTGLMQAPLTDTRVVTALRRVQTEEQLPVTGTITPETLDAVRAYAIRLQIPLVVRSRP